MALICNKLMLPMIERDIIWTQKKRAIRMKNEKNDCDRGMETIK